jgi:hypothetical protein
MKKRRKRIHQSSQKKDFFLMFDGRFGRMKKCYESQRGKNVNGILRYLS